MSMLKDNPVGFFDSGVGGISVLKQAVKLMPREDFIYYGDSKNAPYGTKSVDEVKQLSFLAVDFLRERSIKALVVACNTATSAAIEDIRQKYSDIPVIGIEPALKPAVELGRRGKIIVMATPMTLVERKFEHLMKAYGKHTDICPLPCPGLVELIEQGQITGTHVEEFLRVKLKDFLDKDIAAVVLGCTHYPFIKKSLNNILGEDVPLLDGSLGTSKQLRRQLAARELLSEKIEVGRIEIFNSIGDQRSITLSKRLLEV